MDGKKPRAGAGRINNSMKLRSFTQFINESNGDLSPVERVRLHRLGLIEKGISLLKVRVDWENVGQKKFDGTPMPYMKCWFYENWPHQETHLNSDDVADSWVEYPSSELSRLYLDGEPGDVELADAHALKIARDHGADVLWETTDGSFIDAQTGEGLPDLRMV